MGYILLGSRWKGFLCMFDVMGSAPLAGFRTASLTANPGHQLNLVRFGRFWPGSETLERKVPAAMPMTPAYVINTVH